MRVTQDQHRRLCLLLCYDKRQKGARGSSLVAPFPELWLKAGDRLELCSDLPNVGAFFCISSFRPEGVPLLLWRAESETLCLRRCPLFNRDICLNPNTAVALDLLHTNHLGVMLVYCRHVVWEFLRSGTIVAKIITCSFSARELISDYSYSWCGGTELISNYSYIRGGGAELISNYSYSRGGAAYDV